MKSLCQNVVKGVLIIFLILWGFHGTAQKPSRTSNPTGKRQWFELMQDPDAKFQDVQKSFYKYWEKRLKIKEKEAEATGETEEEGTEESEGEGYQVFKRWEYINRHRVLSDGRLQSPGYVKEVYDKYMAEQDATNSAAGNWTIMGPTTYVGNTSGQPTGMGRLNAIAFHPTDANTMYVGAPSGGFWKTTNLNGNSTVWTNLSNNLPTLGVSSILVHPINPNIIYLGTGDRDGGDAPGLGVYKSTDGGTTWYPASTGMGNVTVGAMVMLPSDPNTILAATSAGIYKSTNGGSAWILKQSGHFKDIKFKPGDPTVVYAARYVSPAEFYRSTNTGDSWTKNTSIPSSSTGSRSVIGVSPADPSYVYLVLTKSDNTFSNLYRSTDYGVNFTAMAVSPPNILSSNCDGTGTSTQATYDLCIAVDPSNINTVYVGGVDIWKTTDGGATWAIKAIWAGTCSGTAVPVHADHHVFEWSPLDGRLYNGNDGGLYYTDNGGSTFTELTGGLAITQIYKIGQGASNVNYCIFGCQDNGCSSTLTGTSFTTVSGGDGGECEIDYANSNYCYDTYVSGSIRRSTTGPLGTFSQIGGNGVNGIDETADWIMPYALHHTVHTTLFAGYKNMWRSTNITSSPPTWVKISSGETVNCEVIEQSPANVDLLYAVRSGSMKRTENANDAAGSVTWTSCTLPGGGTPTDLVAHPTDANTVYATVDYGVYKSTDKGATWTNITGNLPGIFINCIAYDKNSNEGLYVGNQTGVWYKDAAMSNWMLFSNGLPPADVRELEIYYDATPSNNRIKAGTYGRGLWQSDLAAVTVIDPTNFTAFVAGSTQINLNWTKNGSNDNVLLAYSATGVFGQPEDGTAYSAGNTLPGGGTVLYNGSASGYNHTGLSASTKYYYKAWSVNGSNQYSAGLAPISATTDCPAVTSLPYSCSFDNTDCWQVIDNTGQGKWQYGSTSNVNYPTIGLTAPYAYFSSEYGVAHSYSTDLVSPPFNLSGYTTVKLSYSHLFDASGSYSSSGKVYYSLDNGGTWTQLASYTTDSPNPSLIAMSVGAAAGQSQVKFKWTYTCSPTGAYLWAVDDVAISECQGVWTGATSTDWHTTSNWCNNALPDATTDVTIPAGVSNMPYITSATVAYCKDMVIASGATLKMASGTELDVKGNWTCNGSFDYTNSGSSATVKFNGSSTQAAGGASSSTLKRLTIDNTAGVTLTSEIRADNIWLTNGIVTTTGSGKLNLFGGSVTRTNGWVNGTFQKYTWTNPSSVSNVIYELGDASTYTPVSLSFPAGSITVAGGLAVKLNTGDHPSIGSSTLDASLSVNRYWSFPLLVTFSSCSATFGFASGNLDAGTLTGNLIAGQYSSSAWSYPTVGTKTSTSVQITNLASTTLGDIQLAETVPSIPWGNLQWPANGNVALGGTFNVYGQVYLSGVTPGAGAGTGMQSWVGYSTSNTNPSGWTNWVPATYNVDNGNNDEYMANLGASITAPGTWYYAMRYKRGSSSYVYGGYSSGGGGLWDGSTYVSGVLTVTGPTFTGTGNWTDAARWSTGAVPASAVSTIIDGTCTISSAVTTADLTINSGRSVIVASNGQFTVNGVLTNNAGTSGLVIKSDVTGTGSLIHSTGGVPGTAERYIATDWKWHFLASPVSAQPIWTEFSPAPTGTPLSFGPSSWNWDFYYWNPNADTTTGLYWVNLRKENGDYNDGTIDETGNNAGFGTSTPPLMTPGRGYLAAYNTGWTTGSPVTHQFSGSLNEGSISCPVSITSNKFNLAGNPYPSAVDWQATGGWSRTNLALNGSGFDYWIYNDNAGNYGVFNSSTGSGTNGTSRYIASGQAFFVKATSAGSLGMTDAVRVHSTQAWLKNTDEDPSAVRLQLTSTANGYSDEMIVAFNPAFLPGGSEKLRSFYDEAPEIWSVSGSKEYSIVRYTLPSDELVVPVSIKAGVTAGYTITSPGVTGFGLSSRVYLEDLKTGMTQDLKSNPVYSFSASPGDVPERFRLHFGAPFGIGNEDNRSCVAIWITGKKIRIKSDNGCMSDGELSIFNILGQEMIHQRLSGTETSVPMDERAGYYIVKVVTDRQTVVRKVFIPM